MKIFFIYARKTRSESNIPPLGIMSLAAVLRKNGYSDVKLFDLAIHSDEYIIRECLEHRPDLIGLSTDSISYENGSATIRSIQAQYSGARYIAGGVHPTIAPEQTLKETGSEVAVIGEGEETIAELVNRFDSGHGYADVRGIAYFDGGKLVMTEPRPLIDGLDAVPFPARDLLPMDRYLNVCPDIPMLYPTMTIMASRGCKGNCIYCQPVVKTLFGKKMRHRSVPNVIEEIIRLQNTYSFSSLYFADDELLFNGREWIEELCNTLIERKLNLKWVCQGRVDQIDEDLMALMKKSGLYAMGFGVESGSQQILNTMRKGYRVEKIAEAFEICRRKGIITTCNLMVGTPGETRETIQESIDMLRKVKPDLVRVSITTPTPGSDLHAKMEAEGRINLKRLSEFDRWAAYPIRLDGFTKEDIQQSIRDLLGTFYKNFFSLLKRPGILMKRRYFFRILFKRQLQIARNPLRLWKDITFYLTYFWRRMGRDESV